MVGNFFFYLNYKRYAIFRKHPQFRKIKHVEAVLKPRKKAVRKVKSKFIMENENHNHPGSDRIYRRKKYILHRKPGH